MATIPVIKSEYSDRFHSANGGDDATRVFEVPQAFWRAYMDARYEYEELERVLHTLRKFAVGDTNE